MTQTEAWFLCCHCGAESPVGDRALTFSSGRGYCLRCYALLVDEPSPRMSRNLMNQVSAALNQIDTDFFTRQT